MTFAARIARERPTEIALRDREEALTWEDVDLRLRRAATALQRMDVGDPFRSE